MKTNTYVEDFKLNLESDYSKSIVFEDYFILVVKNKLSNSVVIYHKVFDDIDKPNAREVLGESVILFREQLNGLAKIGGLFN